MAPFPVWSGTLCLACFAVGPVLVPSFHGEGDPFVNGNSLIRYLLQVTLIGLDHSTCLGWWWSLFSSIFFQWLCWRACSLGGLLPFQPARFINPRWSLQPSIFFTKSINLNGSGIACCSSMQPAWWFGGIEAGLFTPWQPNLQFFMRC